MSDIIEETLHARYCQPGEKTWDDVCDRVARFISNNENEYKAFCDMMVRKIFVPNSPTLMNAGSPKGQLSACFVLPIEDSMEGIFDSVKNAALIHKTGGGTGFSFGRLRPEGSKVQTTNGVASGPISFMEVFNAATNVIKQGGKRRGANMGILPVWHPDIEKFITCKNEEGKLSNFNISVAITDNFMESAISDGNHYLEFDGEIFDTIKAKELLYKIAKQIMKNGEPGIIFIDTINKNNQVPGLEFIEACNPCGEQPLRPYESCNLGSINLSKFVCEVCGTKIVDYEKLSYTIKLAVKFLNNVIDKNCYPIPEIEEETKKTRKIGLGYMGFADMLIDMGIPYDSTKAIDLGNELMEFLTNQSVFYSHMIALDCDVFPAYEESIWASKQYKMYNATTTCIAPTGSIATLSGCSYGIEPIHSLIHTRYTMATGTKKGYHIVHPLFDEALKIYLADRYHHDNDWKCAYDEVIRHTKETGSIQDIDWLPQEFRDLFKTSLDISWKTHVAMQAAFQKSCHSAISKTINMPSTTTVDDIVNAICYAYHSGLKGFTCYVQGSREDEVLELGSKDTNETPIQTIEPVSKYITPQPRKNMLLGIQYSNLSGCGEIDTRINFYNGVPFEVWINNQGGCEANINAEARHISTQLRCNVDLDYIVKQCRKVKCNTATKSMKNGISDGKSCSDVIGQNLEKCCEDYKTLIKSEYKRIFENQSEIQEYKSEPIYINSKNILKNTCPDCNGELEFGEGCSGGTCPNCGWSGCL